MSERLPYEEQLNQQWNELPLPDENAAWADMKRRLKDDDDDPPVAWWRRGCAVWGLLLLVIVALGWWLIRPEKWFAGKSNNQGIAVQQTNDTDGTKTDKKDTVAIRWDNDTNGDEPTGNKRNITEQNKHDSVKTAESIRPGNIKDGIGNGRIDPVIDIHVMPGATSVKKKDQPGNKPAKQNGTSKRGNTKKRPVKDAAQNEPMGVKVTKPVSDTNETIKTKPIIPVVSTRDTFSVNKKSADSLKKPTRQEPAPVKTTATRQDSIKKKSIFFSAGIALNQQLPVAGQKFTPYNSMGRKGTLLDYIPSVYFRMNKQVNEKDKWFLQGEFRYGAPQYTKEFIYDQNIRRDTGNNSQFSTITSSKLKKTFYHQLPLTFNYYVKPGWSVGAGLVWNKFSSAVSELQVVKHNIVTGSDTFLTKGVIQQQKKDSNTAFSKSYFQAVFETQYKWKRFSFGARYAFGLDPYIRFTLPGGTEQKERNSSLQLFLRYQLWKSKAKSSKEKRR